MPELLRHPPRVPLPDPQLPMRAPLRHKRGRLRPRVLHRSVRREPGPGPPLEHGVPGEVPDLHRAARGRLHRRLHDGQRRVDVPGGHGGRGRGHLRAY